jgi:predicted lipoprotein
MSVVYGRLLLTTTKKRTKQMTVQNKTYQVGDLFTTQKSKVTGIIKAIEPKSANQTLVLLDVDGEERFTTVTF